MPHRDERTLAARPKPAWRRLAGGASRLLYRLATPIDRIVHRGEGTLLPPAHLRIYYYRTWDPKAFANMGEQARVELMTRGLQPGHRVLDIGSGIGNLALSLVDYLQGGYDGIEIHPEAVTWCQQAITPRYPSFRFHRADLASHAYNPQGLASPESYRFPFPDRNFDFIFLASVFTHMLPDAVEQYLREIARLLDDGGTCVASFFLLNDDTRASVEAGRSFMSFGFAHASGLYRLHDDVVPEAAIAYEETFVRDAHERAGLRIADIRRGGWWGGGAHDQDVLTIVRRDDRPTS